MGSKTHVCSFQDLLHTFLLTSGVINPIWGHISNTQPSISLISLQTAAFEWWAGAPKGQPPLHAETPLSDLSSANQIGVFSQEAGFHLQSGDL